MLWINSLFTWHVCVSLELSRLDASVYGLASDGYAFIIVNILHDGTVMKSKQLDILEGSVAKILRCLKHILEVSTSRGPKSRNDDDRDNDEVDPVLNLDYKYMNLPGADDEEDDDF